MKKPNLFIIGAPKCGTTSLREYLASHPNIFACAPEEPHFFCTDLKGRYNRITEFEYIHKYFHGADTRHKVVTDKSTWYLYSKSAVQNILGFNPDAKFIVMVRNPIDMAYSLHSELLWTGEEEIKDFASAYRLQGIRRSGLNLPKNCKDPLILQYSKVCNLGSQLKRVEAIVPQNNLKIVVFDDFIRDTQKIYTDILNFLGLPYDGRRAFPNINKNKVIHFKTIDKILSSVFIFQPCAERVKKALGIRRLGIGLALRWIRYHLNSKPQIRAPMSSNLRNELIEQFREDVALLSNLIGRDLHYWFHSRSQQSF